jgi:trans-2,3-dihydro-3-hydroxyanthranilate isomerase
MNKIFENKPDKIAVTVPVGEIPVRQVGDLVWLQAAQPQFWILFKGRFHYFQQFSSTDFEDAFPIQEVTTGSFCNCSSQKYKGIRAFNYR